MSCSVTRSTRVDVSITKLICGETRADEEGEAVKGDGVSVRTEAVVVVVALVLAVLFAGAVKAANATVDTLVTLVGQ